VYFQKCDVIISNIMLGLGRMNFIHGKGVFLEMLRVNEAKRDPILGLTFDIDQPCEQSSNSNLYEILAIKLISYHHSYYTAVPSKILIITTASFSSIRDGWSFQG
jgi:hypothetical protein